MPARIVKSTFRQNLIRKDKRLQGELKATLEVTGNTLKRKLEDATRGWKHQPRFLVESRLTAKVMTVNVRPDLRRKEEAQIFIYVDQGTKPHKIRAKKEGGLLKFQTGYSAKTAPVAQYGVGTGKASGAWVSKQEVQHPGTQARKFTDTFGKQVQSEFRRRVAAAIRKAMRS